MTEEQQFAKRILWHLYAALALIVVLAIGIGGQWWIGRPKRSAEHFIAVLSKGQINDATAMLVDASAIQPAADGNVTIKGTDGSSATLSGAELPLVALVVPDSNPRNGWDDYLAGRYRFQLATSGPAAQNGERKPTEVYCVAHGNRIIVETVKQ
jgi:hypothetical protein